jgi:membrane-bound lytic murein transglycosylase B
MHAFFRSSAALAALLLAAGCNAQANSTYQQAHPTPRVTTDESFELAMATDPARFNQWLAGAKSEAKARGVRPEIVDQAFAGFNGPIDRIIRLDQKQPEGTITWPTYRERVITDARIREGRELYAQHKPLLTEISQRYGVPPQYIVALWGIETSYGKITGGFSVVHALATLAYDGRRADFFRTEMMEALTILNEGHIAPDSMLGSWAGAMGQCQFMPSSFRRMAVDYNGDGRRDIWQSLPDVFASIANYLSKSGWSATQSWGARVELPANFNMNLQGRETKKTAAEWQALGVKRPGGGSIADMAGRLSVVIPTGSPHAFLTTSNYDVIMKWNRSTYFATAVGQLADAIAGK